MLSQIIDDLHEWERSIKSEAQLHSERAMEMEYDNIQLKETLSEKDEYISELEKRVTDLEEELAEKELALLLYQENQVK